MAKTPKSKKIYRERSPVKFALKLIGIILLVLIILAIIIFFSFQKYIRYDSDGVHLEVPFLSFIYDDEEDISDVELIVESTAPSDASETADASASPSPEAEPLIEGQLISASALREMVTEDTDDILTALEESGTNTLIFELKQTSGLLTYRSSVEAVTDYDLSGDVEIETLIQALEESDVHTVAVLSCFADTTLATRNSLAALLDAAGIAYTDEDRDGWLDPESEYVQAYITDLCMELAEMGFDEILLQNYRYGTEGSNTVLTSFASTLSTMLRSYDVILSLEVESGNFQDALADSGLTEHFERFYIPLHSGAEAFLSEAESVLGDDAMDKIVLISATRLSEDVGWIETK